MTNNLIADAGEYCALHPRVLNGASSNWWLVALTATCILFCLFSLLVASPLFGEHSLLTATQTQFSGESERFRHHHHHGQCLFVC
jgi:hypothetical protein